MSNPSTILLLGCLGHGKTYLVNKICGTRFPSSGGTLSCTTHVQVGHSRRDNIVVVDSPGMLARKTWLTHLAAQKLALEGLKLSGVYMVAKYERADDMANRLEQIIKFVGEDNLRLILTHSDIASQQGNYDPSMAKRELEEQLGIPQEHMLVVGKHTPALIIENFIASTLHEPMEYSVTDEQVAAVAELASCSRGYRKMIDDVIEKMAAAKSMCEEIVENGKSYETDYLVVAIQADTGKVIDEMKQEIFEKAASELTPDQQNHIFGRAGVALHVRKRRFIEETNKCLSFDVTDPTDDRNKYKACNNCGAVYILESGCTGRTTCGRYAAYKGMTKHRRRPKLKTTFVRGDRGGWTLKWITGGNVLTASAARKAISTLWGPPEGGDPGAGGSSFDEAHNRMREGAVIESGCGAAIAWNTMNLVHPSLVKEMGTMMTMSCSGDHEAASRAHYEAALRQREDANQDILEKSGLAVKSA